PPAVASAYMKAVADFQKKHAKHLLRGRFADEDGIAVRGDGIVAKRFVADDGTSAVCAWNISDKPSVVAIEGLGKPSGVFAPGGDPASGPIPPDSLRLYVY
ncbi:MAG: hypothetical protein II649_00540, partial [Kiritimatiellae bacterium]|nr:hypothetical protein [Kiritimatiellia bacterium]